MKLLDVLIAAYAVLCIVLGVYGAVSAREYYSLAGVVIGLLQFGCLWMYPKFPRWSRIASLVIAASVLGMFLRKFITLGKWLPAGVLSIASAVLIVALIAGHLLAMQSRKATTQTAE